MAEDTATIDIGALARGRAAAELILVNDRLRTANGELGARNADLLAQVQRHTAGAREATAELAALNDRVGQLADELAQAEQRNHDLDADLAAVEEDKADYLAQRDDAIRDRDQALRDVEVLRRALDARDMADVERARAAALDSMPDGGQ